jgi:hypothetical protein
MIFFKDWINGSNDNHSYSCVMSCSSSNLGLTETNEEDQIDKSIICSIPVMIQGQDEIVPIDLNLSNDNRTTFTRIIKVIYLFKDIYQYHFFSVNRTCKLNIK